MNEAGLPQKWRRRYFNAKSDQCIGNDNLGVNNRVNNNKNHRISLKNMSGSFVVLLVGIAASFVIFIVELILLRKEKRQQPKVASKIPIIMVKPVKNLKVNNPPATPSDNGNKIQVLIHPLIEVKGAKPSTPPVGNGSKIVAVNLRPPIDKKKIEKAKPPSNLNRSPVVRKPAIGETKIENAKPEPPPPAEKGKVIKVAGIVPILADKEDKNYLVPSPTFNNPKINGKDEAKKEANVVIVTEQAKIDEQQKEKQAKVEHPVAPNLNKK